MSQENFETQEAEIIDENFSPLDAPVKKRSYTNHNINPEDIVEELEEPTFEAPSFSDYDGVEEDKTEPERPFNPQFSELDNKEKAMGAEMMADMTLDLYEKGCGFIGKIPQISESKIDRLVAEGEIDPSIELQTQAGPMPVKDFALEFNDSIKDAFEVSDDFKEKVRPPLIRVFKKRGIGMTDEQLLAYYFLTDLGAKGAQAFMLRKQANSIIDSLKENTLAIREINLRAQRPERPSQSVQQESRYQDTVREEQSYTEDFSNIEKNPVEKPRKQMSNLEEQVQHFEPEETVFANLQDKEGFTDNFKDVAGMPTFGDKKILSELERLSQDDSPKKSVRKRTTATRKPRNKK